MMNSPSFVSTRRRHVVSVCLFVWTACLLRNERNSVSNMKIHGGGTQPIISSQATTRTTAAETQTRFIQQPQRNQQFTGRNAEKESTTLSLCEQLVQPHGGNIHSLWSRVLPFLWNASIVNEPGFDTVENRTIPSLRDDERFQRWVQESSDYFDSVRLQQSSHMGAPMHPDVARKLLRIIEQRLENPDTNPPFKILFFGGSVPRGGMSGENPFHIQVEADAAKYFAPAAYPSRLQDMFNALLGKGTVEIVNLATGSALTQYSTAILGSKAFLDFLYNNNANNATPPHLIVWDHGANEFAYGQNLLLALSKFHEAAQNLGACSSGQDDGQDDTKNNSTTSTTTTTRTRGLPAIIYLDTLIAGSGHGHVAVSDAMAVENAIAKLASWHPDAIAMSYAKLVRHYALYPYHNGNTFYPLFGSAGISYHPGMMYHIGIAWVITYNLLNAFVNACVAPPTTTTRHSNMLPVNHDDKNGGGEKNNHPGQQPNNSTNSSMLEVYHKMGHATVADAQDTPSFNSLPSLVSDIATLKHSEVRAAWQQREQEQLLHCKSGSSESAAAAAALSSCPLSMIVNAIAGIQSQKEFREAMSAVLTRNDGWDVDGTASGKPVLGWNAQKPNAVFEMEYRVPAAATNTTAMNPIRSMTIIYVKTYGPRSSRRTPSSLQVTVEVVSPAPTPTNLSSTAATNPQDPQLPSTTTEPQVRTSTFTLSGLHRLAASFLFPTTVTIPTAQAGDLIRVRFALVAGTSTFKISGLALCK